MLTGTAANQQPAERVSTLAHSCSDARAHLKCLCTAPASDARSNLLASIQGKGVHNLKKVRAQLESISSHSKITSDVPPFFLGPRPKTVETQQGLILLSRQEQRLGERLPLQQQKQAPAPAANLQTWPLRLPPLSMRVKAGWVQMIQTPILGTRIGSGRANSVVCNWFNQSKSRVLLLYACALSVHLEICDQGREEWVCDFSESQGVVKRSIEALQADTKSEDMGSSHCLGRRLLCFAERTFHHLSFLPGVHSLSGRSHPTNKKGPVSLGCNKQQDGVNTGSLHHLHKLVVVCID